MTLGRFPAHSIAAARQWADDLNAKVEAGEDPRAEIVAEKASRAMTLAVAWDHYIAGVSRPDLNKPLKVRTIADKKAIYNRDTERSIGGGVVHRVSKVARRPRRVQGKGYRVDGPG